MSFLSAPFISYLIFLVLCGVYIKKLTPQPVSYCHDVQYARAFFSGTHYPMTCNDLSIGNEKTLRIKQSILLPRLQ